MGCVDSMIDSMCYKEVKKSEGMAPAFSDPEKQAAFVRHRPGIGMSNK
jgi:hypothetical protein